MPTLPAQSALPTAWLTPLPLADGRVALPTRILPGPMEGIMTPAFCAVLAARGLVRGWITPFLRITTAVPRVTKLAERLAPYRLPTVVQLMSTNIDLLVETARCVAALGAIGVDLNCACPSKGVIANGAGGARLREPAWIREALCRLRAAVPEIGVSVKLRGGFADAGELPAILAAVREAQPDFVMLHYRTVREEYRDVPGGWARLAQAKALLGDIPLLGAGDLFSALDALALWRQTGVDGVTPARGLLRNPWLLQEIETLCAGRDTPPRTLTESAGFLRDLAAGCLALNERRTGMLLEVARHLFGRESPAFDRLIGARTVEEMRDYLSEL
jgi:tRNA-dihydrouridine synthase